MGHKSKMSEVRFGAAVASHLRYTDSRLQPTADIGVAKVSTTAVADPTGSGSVNLICNIEWVIYRPNAQKYPLESVIIKLLAVMRTAFSIARHR